MKKTALALTLVVTGCTALDEDNVEPLPVIPNNYFPQFLPNLAEKVPETSSEELKKGPEAPGRVIDYKGHGLGYDSHARHHHHMHSTGGHR